MDGTSIVLVRHGESLAQERQIVGGHEGCQGLSDRGRRQVAALRDRLASTRELGDVAALYASVMPRAVETAEILAGTLGVDDVTRECDLCEQHPGECDGLPWTDVQARWPNPPLWDPDHRRVPGSETFNEMQARVAAVLDRLLERHPGETVVVACHGGVVLHSLVAWLGLDPDPTRSRAWFDAANSSITEWRISNHPWDEQATGIQLVRFNDHAHLAGLP